MQRDKSDFTRLAIRRGAASSPSPTHTLIATKTNHGFQSRRVARCGPKVAAACGGFARTSIRGGFAGRRSRSSTQVRRGGQGGLIFVAALNERSLEVR